MGWLVVVVVVTVIKTIFLLVKFVHYGLYIKLDLRLLNKKNHLSMIIPLMDIIVSPSNILIYIYCILHI